VHVVRVILTGLVLAGVVAFSSLVLACGGGGNGEESNSASASGEPSEAPKLSPKPANATEVDVSLAEWAVKPDKTSVKAGAVYFLVTNDGPQDPHEFVVVQTDRAPDSLPLKDDRVDEGKVKIIDEIPPFTPGNRGSLTLNLKKGKYVLICNIKEVENGEVESHYKLGMHSAFTVE
jgi:uncharacterized cupredoxin-like copper-binding protein